MAHRQLLQQGNTKTQKGEALDYLTGILHLAPGKISGHQVCAQASTGCLDACLYSAGRGKMNSVQRARINKTQWLFQDREGFLGEIVWSVRALERKAAREGMTPCVRLNGTSDLPWEKFRVTVDGERYANIMQAFPHIQFYDYTKITRRAVKWAQGFLPANYHITFSASESNESDCETVAAAGGNVAVVFDELPESWWGRRVISGESSDLRFLDPANCVVGLRAKGDAKRDDSGFVRRVA